MDSRKLASNGRFWFWGVCVLAAAALLLSLDWEKRFVSDVSALLPPADERDEAAELLSQVRQQEERLNLGVLLPPASGWKDLRNEATTAFLNSLRNSNPFEAVARGAGPSDPEAVAAAVYEGRLDLLLPQWVEDAGISTEAPDAEAWAAAIVASFEKFLTQPEANALADLLPADPFPLAATMAAAAPAGIDEPDEEGPLLFWALQIESPFTPEGQAPVFDAFDNASKAAAAVLPGIESRQASVAAFAAESERRIHQEITMLNFFSILLVALVAFFFLRRKVVLIHLVVIAALSVVGGLIAALLFFPTIHVLTLVVGGLLVGVAVDYGIHILLHRPEISNTDFTQTLREVRKPLLASALSTAAGFGALAFGDLPLLRQIGVFVAGGLIAALAVSWLYLPLWPRIEALSSFAESKNTRPVRRWVLVVGAVIFLLPLSGWLRLEWHDDIRELQPPLPELWESDAEIRRMFSGEGSSMAWLCHGETPGEARESLAVFEEQWSEAGGEEADLISLSSWIAAPKASIRIRELFLSMPEFETELRENFEAAGFEGEAFTPFFEEMRRWLSPGAPTYNERLARIASSLDGPSGLLLRGGPEGWFFLVSASEENAPAAWGAPPGAISTVQIENLNELFSKYRQTAWRLSGISLLIIAAGVFLAYGPAAGAGALMLPLLAWAWGMGVLGGTASPLNLFHVLGGFLGFCVALDYGLFFHHATKTGNTLPGSIRVSAATTLSAFGVLSLASIPAVAALGMSVFLVVFAALFMVEMLHLFRPHFDGQADPVKERNLPHE